MIVVTAPSGGIGSQLLQHLLESQEAIRVIARDPSKLPEATRRRVEVVQGSHGDARVVDQAFAGADSVFWLAPPDPKAADVHAAYIDFSRPAADAIKRLGVKRVVAISALGRGTPQAARAGLSAASLAMQDLIASTGVNLRALLLPSLMDNFLDELPSIKSRGAFSSPNSGTKKNPTVARRDVAAAAAELLLDPSWTGQEDVPVLGPDDLSFDEMAATISEVIGRPVRFERISGDAYKQQLTKAGLGESMAQALLDMMVAKEDGLDDGALRVATNRTPTTFRRWCEDVLKPALAG